MKIYIDGSSVDLSEMSRSEIVALKNRIEAEKRETEINLMRPADMGLKKVKRAKEALVIKGRQIHQINEYLRR